MDRLRSVCAEHAIHTVTTLDGAVESIAAVRRHGAAGGGGHRRERTEDAHRHVEHLALDVDHVTGLVVGGRQGGGAPAGGCLAPGRRHRPPWKRQGRPGSPASRADGSCAEEELVEAGTDVVLADLTAFPAWLDAFVAAEEPIGV